MIEVLAYAFISGGLGYLSAYLPQRKSESVIIKEVLERTGQVIKDPFEKIQGGTLRVRLIKKESLEWGTRHFLTLPNGLTSTDLKKSAQALSEALNKDVDVYWDNKAIIEVYNDKISEKVELDENLIEKKNYQVPIGVNQKREVTYLNFIGQFSHLIIAGISGAGKSQLVHLILATLSIKENRPNLYLADLKFGIELGDYEGVEHVKGFVTTLEDLNLMMDLVVHEMIDRYKLMKKNKQKTWKGKPVVCLIDEMIDIKISTADNKEKKILKSSIKEKIAEVTAKGRAARVFMVMATQRPDKEVIDGIIKTNVATTIGFKTRDDVQSKIVLDNTKSADLPYIPGRAYFQQSEDTLIQTFYLSEEKEGELLKNIPRVIYDEPTTSKDGKMESNIINLSEDGFFNHESDGKIIQFARKEHT